MSFPLYQEKRPTPVLLMYLCRLSVLWKAGILFHGGHVPMNEKGMVPETNGDKEDAIQLKHKGQTA